MQLGHGLDGVSVQSGNQILGLRGRSGLILGLVLESVLEFRSEKLGLESLTVCLELPADWWGCLHQFYL